jgi:hypothetical protein
LVELRITDPDNDMARLGVVQRREVLNTSPAGGIDDAFAQAPVQIAHQLGIGLGELTEGAVQELDAGASLVHAVGGL